MVHYKATEKHRHYFNSSEFFDFPSICSTTLAVWHFRPRAWGSRIQPDLFVVSLRKPEPWGIELLSHTLGMTDQNILSAQPAGNCLRNIKVVWGKVVHCGSYWPIPISRTHSRAGAQEAFVNGEPKVTQIYLTVASLSHYYQCTTAVWEASLCGVAK